MLLKQDDCSSTWSILLGNLKAEAEMNFGSGDDADAEMLVAGEES